ncbi:MAG: hypothetical protein RBR16_07825 [Syntrophus sp. (in: bacteria)]|jgi:hypothetical protein|nr:hypothetical protein [Syntrophus sp. (in: bacteria)]
MCTAGEKIQCVKCGHFTRGTGSDHAIGRCTGRPSDGHRGQWPFKRHYCKGFVAIGWDGVGDQGRQLKDMQFYARELQGEECVCLGKKSSGYSFCYKCYKSLPQEMQKALYRKIGDGHEEAYEAAAQYLYQKEQGAECD